MTPVLIYVAVTRVIKGIQIYNLKIIFIPKMERYSWFLILDDLISLLKT